jgi:hypothetical protein
VLGGTLSVAQLATLTAGLSITTVGLSVATGCTVTLNGTSTFTVGTGATLLGGTLGVTGLATLSGGATVPTGQNVTLVGTSTLKHGTRQIQLPASAFQPRGTCVYRAVTTVSPVTLFSGAWQINGSTNALFAAVYLPVGARIINVVTLIARDSASPGGDVSTAVYVDTVGTPGGTNTSFVGTSTSLFTGIGVVNSTSPSINYTIVTNTFTGITVTSTDTAAHDHLVGVQINYDIP